MKKSILVGLSLIIATSLWGADKKVYRLKLAQTYELSMPIVGDVAKRMADLADSMSDGRLKISIDAPSKHKAPFAIYDMVKNGQYDLGYTASYYYKGKNSANMLFTTVPFGMTKDEQHAWYYFGGGKELADKFYAKSNLKVFNILNSGMQMGGWFKKEINTLDDLKGLKFRIPSFGGEVMSRLGVAVATIPVGELYMALEMGTIDAVEWASPSFDIPLGFHKVANYYYTGWQEPASEQQIVINLQTWQKLPRDLQNILEASIAKAREYAENETFYKNVIIWDEIKKKYPNVQIRSFSPEIMRALRKATDEILAEESEKNPDFKEIWESQKTFLAKARTWTKMGDFTYIEKTGDVEAEQNFTASVKKISIPEPVNSAASEINASTAAPKNEDNQTK